MRILRKTLKIIWKLLLVRTIALLQDAREILKNWLSLMKEISSLQFLVKEQSRNMKKILKAPLPPLPSWMLISTKLRLVFKSGRVYLTMKRKMIQKFIHMRKMA